MKKLKFLAAIALVFVCGFAYSDTLKNKTITSVFINKGSLVAFTYEPVDPVNNPNNCNVDSLQLDPNAAFFKEQYVLLLVLKTTGKLVDINVGTDCGQFNLIAEWFKVH